MRIVSTAVAATGIAALSSVVGALAYDQLITWRGDVVVEDPHGILKNIANGEEFAISYGPNRKPFPCADVAVSAVKQDAERIRSEFDRCKKELAVFFASRPELEEPELFAIFTTIVVNRLAPYGFSKEGDWRKIPQEPMLNCSQHSIFVAHTIKHFFPEVEVVRYGVEGGAIGNHALVAYKRGEHQMVLDGMTAMVVFHSMDGILKGDLVNTYGTFDFYFWNDEAVEIARRNIRGSLRMGAIRAQHVIYRQVDDRIP